MESDVEENGFRDNQSFQLAVQMYVRRYFRSDGSLPVAEEVIIPVLQSAEIEAMKPLYKRLMSQALTNLIVERSSHISGLLVNAEKISNDEVEDLFDKVKQERDLQRVKAILSEAQETQKEILWMNSLVEAIPDA